jgi:putative selenate reductase
MCNECGNCAAFCPHAGDPCKDKFTIFADAEAFADSNNTGIAISGPDTYKVRLEDKTVKEYCKGQTGIPGGFEKIIEVIAGEYSYLLS